MWRYLLKRVLIAVPVLWGITVIDFLIMNLAGSPLAMLSGPKVTEAMLKAKAAQYGLDQPVWVQYFRWLGELLRGNLGYSMKSHQPVAQIIGEHIWPTVLLMGSSLLLGLLLALPFGIYSALHARHKRDHAIVGLSLLGNSVPGFFLALLVIYFFNVKWKLLPSGGMYELGKTSGTAAELLRHMALPVLVLTVSVLGSNIRYVRSAMLDVLSQDYVRTARGKGVGRFRTVYLHAFRNALLPIATIVGMQLPILFGGAVIVEQLFSWPGLGLITMNAISGRDYPLIMGVCLLTALIVLAANLLTDMVYIWIDPTIDFDGGRR